MPILMLFESVLMLLGMAALTGATGVLGLFGLSRMERVAVRVPLSSTRRH